MVAVMRPVMLPPSLQQAFLCHKALVMALQAGLAVDQLLQALGAGGVELPVNQGLDILRCHFVTLHPIALLLFLLVFLSLLSDQRRAAVLSSVELKPMDSRWRDKRFTREKRKDGLSCSEQL